MWLNERYEQPILSEEARVRLQMRSQYEAFTAMRNDINEMFGDMISQEATLKDGPEMSAECAAVVESLRKVRARLDELEDRILEMGVAP